jgi:hypothetical protein
VRKRLGTDSKHENAYICYLAGFLSFTTTMAFVNMYNVSYFFFLYTAAILRLAPLAKKDEVTLAPLLSTPHD